jgi:hypothetical protein
VAKTGDVLGIAGQAPGSGAPPTLRSDVLLRHTCANKAKALRLCTAGEVMLDARRSTEVDKVDLVFVTQFVKLNCHSFYRNIAF